MKILLAALNSKFNHTNLAVRSIKEFCKSDDVEFDEYTINMNPVQILRGIFFHSPDVVIFSTYIWNVELVKKIIPDLKKILPNVKIGCGGPEVSYAAEHYFNSIRELDFIIKGEGEQTVKELLKNFSAIKNVKGIYFREGEKIIFTGERELICNLDDLVFPYSKIDDAENKIFYYESSRGCPFSCAYCMSSLDKKVRFLSLERVYKDIQIFLDANVPLVKFVDRTYNLNEERYLKIWRYILDHHNKKTVFHFEIEAEFLSEAALEFLKEVPEGVMQFEIGVQSANPKTLEAVGRSSEIKTLEKNIRAIPKTIHKHLDLIAGLPFEDLDSFGASYDFAMSLSPDALQLGFLKILYGTQMEKIAKTCTWKWMQHPPYETFSTPHLNFEEMLFLKDVEILTDVFFNSGIFDSIKKYVERNFGFWNFIKILSERARKTGALDAERKINFWFDFLANNSDIFFKPDDMLELLKFDFIRQQKTSSFPDWMEHNYNKAEHLNSMIEFEKKNNCRIEYKNSEYDIFKINPLAEIPENTKGNFKILFIYENKNSSLKKMQVISE